MAKKKLELFQYDDLEKRRSRSMKAKELDKKFDSGEDITEFLDLPKARRPGQEQKRVILYVIIERAHNWQRKNHQ